MFKSSLGYHCILKKSYHKTLTRWIDLRAPQPIETCSEQSCWSSSELFLFFIFVKIFTQYVILEYSYQIYHPRWFPTSLLEYFRHHITVIPILLGGPFRDTTRSSSHQKGTTAIKQKNPPSTQVE